MNETPEKMYWMGRDIDEMPREELLEVIRSLADELKTARETTRSIIGINMLARRRTAR